ncbi:MAG: hypothetical protein ABI691_15010 [Ginsengibacter sp.]
MKKYLAISFFIFFFSTTYSQTPLKTKQFFHLNGIVDIPASGNGVIYVVPRDSVLIITDFYLDAFFAKSSVLENAVPVITIKNKEWFQSNTGILFKPRAKIAIHNESDGAVTRSYYQLIGYFLHK